MKQKNESELIRMIGSEVMEYAFDRVLTMRIQTILEDICRLERLMKSKRNRLKSCKHPQTKQFQLIQTKIDSFKELVNQGYDSESMVDHMDQVKMELDLIVLEVRELQASTGKYSTLKNGSVSF